MPAEILYLDCALCVLDFITITALRSFLFDFLIGQKNRKSAKKLYEAQEHKERITLGYILPHLKKHKVAFKRYHTLYLAVLYTLFPQYIIVFICNMIFERKSMYVVFAFGTIKLLIAIIIRCQTDSLLISKYRKK